ncbi:AAA family ATPase [Erythrobacter donghaensis]|uniref:AAA family ATPase n=1 Tax=Erythrobacter donghaensis TaxID=267135 RepID=UPI000A3A2F48|nr:AAA family ATPase [Erythrobacter donghaensis]
MRIDSIEVQNFRGIREIALHDLKSTVVIAGANGSGKSCIFDAIRLLKSAYGGYQQNEWHHWMSEFQINFTSNSDAFRSFFQDQNKKLSIRCEFRLNPSERKYLELHGEELVRNSVWRLIAPEMYGWSSYRAAPMAAQYRDREPEVTERTLQQLEILMKELAQETVVGHLWADSGSDIHFSPSKALEIIFSSFLPGELGLIDYHGPQRMYNRELLQNVNLDLTSQDQHSKQHALYNYNNKYNTVKTEMASSYIKELLAKEAGVPFSEQNAIATTLKELFATFFPDKFFVGLKPTADGGLEFPVRTASGAIHDLNELSAGEKEVLFGYLRIRNSAPCYSIILLDEPELHLNPRLIQGLPQFYHQHLGVALENQIWLVTHSDTLLREVVGRPEYSVFHMTGASVDTKTPQISQLTLAEDAERALISLVGDIAAYRPGKKVVLFEGGGDSEFDVTFTTRLFPELSQKANVISGGNKLRVRELHDVLDQASKTGSIPFNVYSITDQDSETKEVISSPRFQWDVYHIENYLLEVKFLKSALTELGEKIANESDEKIYDCLRMAAAGSLNSLLSHEISSHVRAKMRRLLQLGFDPQRPDIGTAVHEAFVRSSESIAALRDGELKKSSILALEARLRKKFERQLGTDTWRKTFRGRDILRQFAHQNCRASYEILRNVIISRMADASYKPAGMRKIIDVILND